jgi:hypothetical protein
MFSIQDGTLVIRRYYFPTATKRIALAAIAGVEEYPMTKATGRPRIWGFGGPGPLVQPGPGPAPQAAGVVVDLGRRPKPVVTPTTRRLPRRPRCGRDLRREQSGREQGAGWRPPAMSRPGRLLTWGGLAALLVLAGCTSATGSTAASRVAFASDRRRNVDLYVLELPSGRRRRLTSSPAADLAPTWASDGRRLAFRSDRDGNPIRAT